MLWGSIQHASTLQRLKATLSPLINTEITYLQLPYNVIKEFEPSQVGTIVGTLTDAILPELALQKNLGLSKYVGQIGFREGYPDFIHLPTGYRLELKGLFIDNPNVRLKMPPTPREPSARLTQKVTVNKVQPDTDGLLIISYQLAPMQANPNLICPVIKAIEILPVVECVRARDFRLSEAGGIWFGNFQTPTILSARGRAKMLQGIPLDQTTYGRKESEGKDYNEDTNFGKLKRIPYKPLQEFLKSQGVSYTSIGNYPSYWKI